MVFSDLFLQGRQCRFSLNHGINQKGFLFHSFRFAHPYQYELDHFTPPDSVLLQKPQPQVRARPGLRAVSESRRKNRITRLLT